MALEHIHSLGIAHRDLKPENLMYKSHDVNSPDYDTVKVHRITLQHTATHCNAPATHCNTMCLMYKLRVVNSPEYDTVKILCIASLTPCNTLQHSATHCITPATHCNTPATHRVSNTHHMTSTCPTTILPRCLHTWTHTHTHTHTHAHTHTHTHAHTHTHTHTHTSRVNNN